MSESVKEQEETPAYYVKSAKRGSGSKNKNDRMISMMANREGMMQDFTNSFSTFVKTKTENPPDTKPNDDIDTWAKIFGNRVRELEPNIRRRFMHHVDGLVIDATEGLWAP